MSLWIYNDNSIEKDSLFRHFKCFEAEVYYGIIVSIIVISFVSSLYKQSLKSFFTIFWSYLSVILSDYHTMKTKNIFDRLLLGLWLIVCTLLLSAFSGQLREQILRPRTIHWIDTWDDLYEWKHLKILTFRYSALKLLTISSPNDTYSQVFSKRIDKIESLNHTWVIHDIERVKAGEVALVFPNFVFYISKNNLISYDQGCDI